MLSAYDGPALLAERQTEECTTTSRRGTGGEQLLWLRQALSVTGPGAREREREREGEEVGWLFQIVP